ncbi:MAG: hypothetical protein ACI94Y_001399 [Maribacter sp.]|jgi:hypothetical protein
MKIIFTSFLFFLTQVAFSQEDSLTINTLFEDLLLSTEETIEDNLTVNISLDDLFSTSNIYI